MENGFKKGFYLTYSYFFLTYLDWNIMWSYKIYFWKIRPSELRTFGIKDLWNSKPLNCYPSRKLRIMQVQLAQISLVLQPELKRNLKKYIYWTKFNMINLAPSTFFSFYFVHFVCIRSNLRKTIVLPGFAPHNWRVKKVNVSYMFIFWWV